MFKILKSEKGSGIMEFIVVIAVVAILAVSIFPDLTDALNNRIDATINSYNGTDTITIIE